MSTPNPTTKYFLASALPPDSAQPGMIISTPAQDREGDRVVPTGGDFSNFLKNPVLVWAHDYKTLPVGRVTSIEVQPDAIKATWDWLKNDEFADRVKNAWDQGVISAASIGFIPTESTPNSVGGNDITAWEMLELTLCVVPMNPTAVRAMKSLLDLTDAPAKKKAAPVTPALLTLLASLKCYMQESVTARPSGYDVSDATHAIDVLHRIGSSETADGHAHAAHLQSAATHVIQYLQEEFNEQFGIAPDGSPDISDAEIKDDDVDQDAATDTPFIPMDDDSKYPFVSATGLTGDAKIALVKGINEAVKARFVAKRGRRISAANEAKLKNAHAHLKAAHETVGEVLACVKDEVEPTDGTSADADNLGGDPTGMIALSLDDSLTFDVDDIVSLTVVPSPTLDTKDADVFDVDAATFSRALRDVVRDSLSQEVSAAMQTAIDRARGRVVV